jgi:hypothetical protein
MPKLGTAFLANAASVDPTGLVSVLGAFVEVITPPQLPTRIQLWLVARMSYEEGDLDESMHTFTIRVDHQDGEPVARIDGGARFVESPNTDPDLPSGFQIVLPLALELRRGGLYFAQLLIDGEEMWRGPFKVRPTLPGM